MEKAEDMIANVALPKKPTIPIIHDKIKDMIAKPMSCLKSNSMLSNKRDAESAQK
ncbi:hypothetical protein KN10_1944 [Anoxybacillus flavithermus NBRC 109594]|uniref:Uncharacterized protein n=1 Tax=Anoxybacillus flavithermus NBRC 109594 TaxID=1315967 RepID=R4G1F7_9BACL|nr:hypothetical protein KN10_1944 [Anoxybacillus flavithermus NBRC 109594]